MGALSKRDTKIIHIVLHIRNTSVFLHITQKKNSVKLIYHFTNFSKSFSVLISRFFSFITSAIQELQSNITQLMKQRDEAQLQANEKDRQLSELRREVNNVIDKKKRLEHELERLKQHLVQVEEGYTNEALASEERERELRKKLQVNKEQTISGR